MKTKKILVVNDFLTDSLKEAIEESARSRGYRVCIMPEGEEALLEAADAEIIYGQGRDLLNAGRAACWFCACSAGVDHLLEGGPLPKGLILTNSAGAYGLTISEHIVMVLLELLRQRSRYLEIVQRREWIRTLPVRSIFGSTVTILGTGNLGSTTARRIRGFDPAGIIGLNRTGNASKKGDLSWFDAVFPIGEMEKVLPGTDILIACLPGTDRTHHLLSEEVLRLLPPRALIINVGRGSAIDQTALVRLLNEERLAGAALDVFDEEPIPENDPIWDCKNLLITPHIAGNMTLPATMEKNVGMFLSDFENYCEGRPLRYLVDQDLGY